MKNVILILIFITTGFAAQAQNSEIEKSRLQKEVVTKPKIKVFPNPATNVVNILGLQNSAEANITISDVSGSIMLQHQWAIKNKALSIPIPNLEAGIYVVHIASTEQQVQTKFYKN